jgi:hypothetical protein
VSETDDLRKLISKKREAVTRKIARNRREKSVMISSSEYDPRVPHTELRNATRSELAQVLHSYNEFLARHNQFVEGYKGTPIPRHEWQETAKKIETLKQKGEQLESVIGKAILPTGNTLASTFAGVKPNRENANQAFSPYPIFNRKSQDFKSLDSLRKFDRLVSKQNLDNWEAEAIKANREHLKKMQRGMGESNEIYEQMTDFQFMLLWATPGFLEDKGIKYKAAQARLAGKAEIRQEAQDAADTNIKRLEQWALSQAETPQEFEYLNLTPDEYKFTDREWVINRIKDQYQFETEDAVKAFLKRQAGVAAKAEGMVQAQKAIKFFEIAARLLVVFL